MKKFPQFVFIFLPLFVSLFLFPNLVKADTISLVPDSTSVSLVSSASFENIHQIVLDTMAQNNYSYYNIFYEDLGASQEYRVNFYNTITSSLEYSSQYNYINFSITGTRYVYRISNDGSTITYINSYSGAYIYVGLSDNTFDFIRLLDSTLPLVNTTNHTFDITYNNNTTSILPNDNFLGLYQILHPVSPTPPDNTPLLTQFFDISIEKLQLICDFFTSSYVYLSIFVIFILYFVILLLRRLK